MHRNTPERDYRRSSHGNLYRLFINKHDQQLLTTRKEGHACEIIELPILT